MTDIITEKDIELLVHSFYDKVRNNDRLGYIFNEYAQVKWSHHLPKMVDFWSNLLFHTGNYRGKPFLKHKDLPVRDEDFLIWLNLFKETVDELFIGENAKKAKSLAKNISLSFSYRLLRNN